MRTLFVGKQHQEHFLELDGIGGPFPLKLLGETRFDAGVAELGCHPGRVTEELNSSYTREREIELDVLTDPGLPAKIEALGFERVSYRDWRA